ncbi:cytochrome P450 [Streptomyces sediminimaris]|uniref:cytochrome P450 n=1 Tax=Streptomyces sediminimaris TaxID=3383721 RepID=UPI00399A51CF
MTAVEHPGLMASDLPVERRVCPRRRQATEGPAVRRVRTPAGDQAWLVTGYAQVRDLLRDERLGRSHPRPGLRARYAGDPTYDQVMSADHTQADTMHHGIRNLIKPQFTTRRMLAMRPRVRRYAAEQVDVLIAKGPPTELRTDFSEPLIRRVLCDLFGVPDSEVGQCVEFMRRSASGDTALATYLRRLIMVKRFRPDDGVVARLCQTDTPDEQVVQALMLMQFAGVGATSKQIAYGVLLLAEHAEQRSALAADPALVPSAVEELLRLSGSLSLPRYAREDIEMAGVTIGEGDLVLLDLTSANFDEAAFADATTLDPARSPNRHLTFSYGVWTCLGAPLARMLLAVVFEELLTRMPNLRPAAPVDPRSGPLTGGLPERLELTW